MPGLIVITLSSFHCTKVPKHIDRYFHLAAKLKKCLTRHLRWIAFKILLQYVSWIWASLTWLQFVNLRLELISITAPAASKMVLALSVVKIDSKIIILSRESKSVTYSVCSL